MPHEGPHSTWSKVTPDFFAFAVTPEPERDVLLRVDLPGEDAHIILQMSIADARHVAEALAKKALEAEQR
jgi:hypothetical protein